MNFTEARRMLAGIAILVLIGISFGGCSPSMENPGITEKVTIGISATSLLPALIHVAEEKGYFLEEGIDIVIEGYPTGKAALEATFNGEVDMGTVAETPVVFNSFERDDFAVFTTIVGSVQHCKVIARKDRGINTPQDLIGKKLATTIGTTAHFFMAVFFAINGMDISDVEIIDLKPGEMVEEIVNGEVDAIFTWEPNIMKAQEGLGSNAVILASKLGYQATFNLASMNDFIENNPQLIEKTIKALVKAEEFINNNRVESINIIAQRLDTDREGVDKLWDDYEFGLSLSQFLIVTLEDEARWAIKSKLTDKIEVPNYLDYIYMDALDEVKPEAIGIIR